jgi:hypothetical protein
MVLIAARSWVCEVTLDDKVTVVEGVTAAGSTWR